MCEGYNPAGNDDRPNLEDEFLCEYVDGTMDPVVEEVFEEYLRSNPALREHVECLRNTRMLLCRYGCRCHAPLDLQERLRRQISCDLMRAQVPFQIVLADRFRTVATVASTLALLFLLGTFSGISLTGPGADGAAVAEVAAVASDGRTESGHGPRQTVLQTERPFYPSYSTFAPLSAVRSIVLSSDRKDRLHRSDTSTVVGATNTLVSR